MHTQEYTLEHIGKRFNISRQRVFQIIKRYGQCSLEKHIKEKLYYNNQNPHLDGKLVEKLWKEGILRYSKIQKKDKSL